MAGTLEGIIRTGELGRMRDWFAEHGKDLPADVHNTLKTLTDTGYLEGGGGVTDHGELTGLEDDDHSQYHDDTRADARYFTQSQVNGIKSDLQGEIDSDVYAHAQLANVHHMAFEDDDCDAKITTHTGIAGAHHAVFVSSDCAAQITSHAGNTSAHHARYADSEAKAAAVSDAAYGSGWSTVTDVAPSKKSVYDKIQTMGGDVTYLERLGMYGSANAEWVPLIFEMASPDGDNVGIPAGAAVVEVSDIIAAAGQWLYGLAMPPAKNQLKLYAAANGIRFYLSAANSTNYVTDTWLIGVAENGTVTTIYTDATDRNAAGLVSPTNTLQDLSGYEKVFVKLNLTIATANALKVKFVSMKVYYA